MWQESLFSLICPHKTKSPMLQVWTSIGHNFPGTKWSKTRALVTKIINQLECCKLVSDIRTAEVVLREGKANWRSCKWCDVKAEYMLPYCIGCKFSHSINFTIVLFLILWKLFLCLFFFNSVFILLRSCKRGGMVSDFWQCYHKRS